MSIANSIAAWQKGGTRVALLTSVSSGAAPDLILHDESIAFIPDPSKALVRRATHTGGGAQALSQNHVLGRAAANGQLRLPLTAINLALVTQSLLQDVTYSTNHYDLGVYTSPATTKWMYIETGVAGSDTIVKCYGCRVTAFTIEIPTVTDEDPGNPMIVADVVVCNAERVDAFTSGGSPTTDTAEPYTGRDLLLKINGTQSASVLRGSVRFDVGLVKSKVIGSTTPTQLYANALRITGSITAYATTSSGDAHQTLIDLHEGKTDGELGIVIEAGANDHEITWDCLFEAPAAEDEDGMMVRTFGFQNVDDNGDRPQVLVYTTDMSW